MPPLINRKRVLDSLQLTNRCSLKRSLHTPQINPFIGGESVFRSKEEYSDKISDLAANRRVAEAPIYHVSNRTDNKNQLSALKVNNIVQLG